MKDKRQLLQDLINRNEELKPIVFKTFDTEKELDKYTKSVQQEVDEYYENKGKIEQLEYDLMSLEEQESYDEYRRLSKLKAEGKFPI